MDSSEKQSVSVGSNVLLVVVVLLLSAIAGIVCIIYTKVALDRGPLWFLAALGFIPAALGIIAALATMLIASIRRRITGGFLISGWLIIAIVAIAWWYSLHFIRDPYAP
ncbi:MAG TPA: hypothetical protein VKH63_20740 [Candidatus Acidoferrum sp.]|jgi:hypothetical protein|nr:hypothetical protein [Candidatus Acidoferrum sp.]